MPCAWLFFLLVHKMFTNYFSKRRGVPPSFLSETLVESKKGDDSLEKKKELQS